MKYISYERDGLESIGVWVDGRIFDIPGAARSFGDTTLKNTMLGYLEEFQLNNEKVRAMLGKSTPSNRPELFFPSGQAHLLAPLPYPRSIKTLAQNGDSEAGGEQRLSKSSDREKSCDEVQYSRLYGSDQEIPYPEESNQFDFGFSVAVVIGEAGKSILMDEAQNYIAGITIINRWMPRDVEVSAPDSEEMIDLPLSMGPYLVTLNELQSALVDGGYQLQTSVMVNGKNYSSGNLKTLSQSLGQMVALASQENEIHPGDVICSGIIAGGSIQKLGKEQYNWIQIGDKINLQIEKIGTLMNTITNPCKQLY